tara:strand:+ start:329 stop:568 length:240 start_codon:yes stop_codon:yes gene_type:complete
MNDYPRGLTLNLNSIEDAREYLRDAKARINPSNATIKKPVVSIRLLLQNDYDLLTQAVTGMHNMKMFRFVHGAKKYTWE